MRAAPARTRPGRTALRGFAGQVRVVPAERRRKRSHPVGLLKPNDLGLFDMLGNAFEWTADRYTRDSVLARARDRPQRVEKSEAPEPGGRGRPAGRLIQRSGRPRSASAYRERAPRPTRSRPMGSAT